MPRLFGRAYVLQVDDLEIRSQPAGHGLNVAFSVERTLRRRPGSVSVKVWNLSEDHRRQLESIGAGQVYCRLSAGYEGAIGQIFEGRLHRAIPSRSGADVIVEIKSRDGGHATSSARSSRSHAAGTSVSSVVSGLVGDLGLGLGNLPDVLDQMTIGGVSSFGSGYVASGSTAEELDGLFDSAGFEWSVQDGAIQVLPRGRGLTRAAVRLVSSTGLLETGAPDERGRIECKAMMIPELCRPGQLFTLEESRAGTYRIEKSKAAGEYSSAQSWGVTVTGAPV